MVGKYNQYFVTYKGYVYGNVLTNVNDRINNKHEIVELLKLRNHGRTN
jgi:hypothetical protein